MNERKKKRYKPVERPVYQIIQDFLAAKCERKECAKLASEMKSTVKSNYLSDALTILFKKIPRYKNIIWGYIFPVNNKELGEGNNYFFKSENIEGEIEWLLIQINRNKRELKNFIECREEVEKAILLGQYDVALQQLDALQRNCGISVWLLEMKMLIYSYSDDENSLMKLVSELNREKGDEYSGLVTLLISFLSKRCSKSYSPFAFDAEMDRYFKTTSNSEKDGNIYFQMRLNFYKSYRHKDMSPALIFEATNSLIDRYIILISILKASFATAGTETQKNNMSSYALKVYCDTGDMQILPLIAYSHKKKIPLKYYNERFISILDSYYKGDYQDVISKCKNFIINNYPYYDLLEIYTRSLIALDKGFIQIANNNDCIINQIINNLYKSMTEVNNNNYLKTLYHIDKNIYGLSLACGLDYYIDHNKNDDGKRVLKYLSMFYFDPAYCKIFENNVLRNNYLCSAKSYIANSIAVSYQLLRINGEIENASDISNHILSIDKAKKAFKLKNYEESLNSWAAILKANNEIIPIAQCAIDFIYRCHMEMENIQAAISFYVNQYLKGETYVSRIDAKPLTHWLYKNKYKGKKINGLDLQLFVFLNEKEDARKSCVLERFCAYKDVERASDLIPELENDLNREKVEMFFYMLATLDILRHFIYSKSTEDIIEEQLKIAQYLSNLQNNSKHKMYYQLLQRKEDEKKVYQSVKKIDESKIFADKNALLNCELNELEGLYAQFKKQFHESTNLNDTIYVLDTLSQVVEESALICTNLKYVYNSFSDIACQLFIGIREKFLFSKFGLKTYLSTRIRHGVLEGELRADFDSLHLLLLMENNKYIPTDYWEKKYKMADLEKQLLMRMLEKFSRGITKEIDTFKEDVLQIKLTNDERGMFDYIFRPEEMCHAVVSAEIKANNYKEFAASVINYLFRHTNKCLVKVRKEVQDSLLNGFMKYIDSLSQDIIKFEGRPIYKELYKAINQARVKANQKAAHVVKWFYLQDVKFDDFILTQQMLLVWNITLKLYPNVIPDVDSVLINDNIIIKADYFIHFSDILTIAYNNMLCHSKPAQIRKFKISLYKESDNCIRLHFENDIKVSEDELNKIFKDMSKSYSRLQTEGHSGLVKVRKIIKYDLGCEKNDINIKAENGKCMLDVVISLNGISL